MDCWPEHHSQTHLEVLRIHMQLLAVQLAQLRKGLLDVIQVLHGVPKRSQHLLTMGKDLGVVEDGAGRETQAETGTRLAQPPCRSSGFSRPGSNHEVAMGLGLPGQGFTTAFLHIDLGPQAGNIMLLVRCPVHHGGESGSARHVSWVRNQ
uniref:Uncharacterized protein n=1 Tax=Gopherus agassizii TaxID=38772 RepID=A0A452HU04_9SAUR